MELLGQSTRLLIGFAQVYTLSDMQDNVFYIGVTMHEDVDIRFRSHISSAVMQRRVSEKEKNDKIVSLNFQIKINVIERVWVVADDNSIRRNDWSKYDLPWIEWYKRWGCILVNKPAKSAVVTKRFKGSSGFRRQKALDRLTGICRVRTNSYSQYPEMYHQD